MLCKSHAVETAVDTKGYSLLLIKAGPDEQRAIHVVSEIQRHGAKNSTHIATVIAQQMSLDDALAGQFALSCCDCVSAFVPDDVVYDANAPYVQELSEAVMQSPEFQPITVRIVSIPPTDNGRRFSWQFLGVAVGVATPSEIQVHRKKARLMVHWATKCGVHLDVDLRW